jgi:hypothetical protein
MAVPSEGSIASGLGGTVVEVVSVPPAISRSMKKLRLVVILLVVRD